MQSQLQKCKNDFRKMSLLGLCEAQRNKLSTCISCGWRFARGTNPQVKFLCSKTKI